MPYTIGVDLGGTNIVAALADETGRLLARAHRRRQCRAARRRSRRTLRFVLRR